MVPDESSATSPAGNGLCNCPCCHLLTLTARADYEICRECGWEDDGQDDPRADELWGGPNGSLTLTEARASYAKRMALNDDPTSVANGGEGLWWSAVDEYRTKHPERY